MWNPLRCLILIIYSLILCPDAHSQLQKIYLHPKAAGNEKQSNVVDSIRLIPLDVKDGIEFTAYNSTEVTNHHFLIRDYSNKAILIYDRSGHFIKKINYTKLGEGFYPMYDEPKNQLIFFGSNKNYALTNKDQIKIKLDWNSPRNKKYYKKYTIDMGDTAFTLKKATPQQNDILHAYPYYDDLFAMTEISTSELYKDSLDHEFKLYRNNQLVKGFFPYNRINEPKYLYTQSNMAISKTDTPWVNILTRPFCDTVYKMVRDSVFPYYQLVMPLENSLPATFFTTPFRNKTERENFSRNNGWMLHQIYMFYETSRFIYFWVGYQSNFDSYIHYKASNTTYKTKNIKADTSQYNLSLFEGFGVSRKGNKFYKTIKAGDLLEFFEKNKQVAIPSYLESFIKSKPPVTTPVIVEFTIKK